MIQSSNQAREVSAHSAIADARIASDAPEARPWHALFSSLYLAELAAAEQAALAAKAFECRGDRDATIFYRGMAREERQHAALVRWMFDDFVEPPAVAREIYEARRCQTTGGAQLVERLALVHLVFEPSALAFLSHIFAEAPNLFAPEWAGRIRSSCRQILNDEAAHVRRGRTQVAMLLADLSADDLQLVRRSIRTHRAFLSAGIKRFFASSERFAEVARVLDERYTFAFTNAVSGVIEGVM